MASSGFPIEGFKLRVPSLEQTEPKTQSEGGDRDSMQNKMAGTNDGDLWWGSMRNCNNEDDDDDDLISKMT